MRTVRRSEDRGHFDHGWLDTFHTFSFGAYRDPEHMGFHGLRVINEDIVKPGAGFGEHPHRDMEIITYVVAGELAHRDSTGGEGVIRPGMVQAMTAGRGLTHSEFNASTTEPVRLLQIWIEPDERGLDPGYRDGAIAWPDGDAPTALVPIASGRAAHESNGALPIHQDATVYAGRIDAGRSIDHSIEHGRHAWLQLITGSIEIPAMRGGDASIVLRAGDGLAVSEESALTLSAVDDAEFLLFDLS